MAINAHNSDYSIRKLQRNLMRKFDDILKVASKLDNAEIVLSLNLSEIRKYAKEIQSQMMGAVMQFLDGDGRSFGAVHNVIKNAQDDFFEGLKKYNLKLKRTETAKLTKAFIESYAADIEQMIKNTYSAVQQKSALIHAMADAQSVPAAYAEKEASKMLMYSLNGKRRYISEKLLSDAWASLNKRYGMTDTMFYRKADGGRFAYPMRSYLDMKTVTVSQEAYRITTEMESAENGIYTVKISSHGSRDSCIYHEGEVCFINDAARMIFLEKFPQYKQAARWKTLEEIKNDKTHMFKPNCRHITMPYPIDLMSEGRFKSEVENNVLQKIPAKINEAAIAKKSGVETA